MSEYVCDYCGYSDDVGEFENEDAGPECLVCPECGVVCEDGAEDEGDDDA